MSDIEQNKNLETFTADGFLDEIEKISGKPLTLGNLLWSIRKGEEWTQVQLAEKLNVSTQYVCDVENGEKMIDSKTAAEFADKLGYSKSQFIRLGLKMLADECIEIAKKVKSGEIRTYSPKEVEKICGIDRVKIT